MPENEKQEDKPVSVNVQIHKAGHLARQVNPKAAMSEAEFALFVEALTGWIEHWESPRSKVETGKGSRPSVGGN